MDDGVRLPADFRPELVVLDRDGVLNRNLDHGVRCEADWAWLPGATTALRRLVEHGVRLMVVTNQANIGRGILTSAQLTVIHRRMVREMRPVRLTLTDILCCPHRPEDGCACRKPEPGLIHTALRITGASAARTLVIGDHESDIAAAAAARCWSLHVRSGRGSPPASPRPQYLGSVADLLAATRILIPAGR
jgi:D-glycero-D-manno-heptose 1,7-bisphosphate phosphatase